MNASGHTCKRIDSHPCTHYPGARTHAYMRTYRRLHVRIFIDSRGRAAVQSRARKRASTKTHEHMCVYITQAHVPHRDNTRYQTLCSLSRFHSFSFKCIAASRSLCCLRWYQLLHLRETVHAGISKRSIHDERCSHIFKNIQ